MQIINQFKSMSCSKSSSQNTNLSIKSVVYFFLLLIIGPGANSCNEAKTTPITLLRPHLFDKFEKYRLENDTINLAVALNELQAKIQKDDVENTAFLYYYKGQLAKRNTKEWAKYADSALMGFQGNDLRHQYPAAYITALNFKCDVLIYYKNYEQALANYFIIKSMLSNNNNPILLTEYLSSISNLFFQQNQFENAAQYNLQAFKVLESSKDAAISDVYRFHLTQAALNNAGFSFENANQLDSAEYFYNLGLKYIDMQLNSSKIPKNQLEDSRQVFLDNLGGLMAKLGKWDDAKNYLEESIAANNGEVLKAKSTAYIKLAKVYIHFGKFNKADSLLQIAENINIHNNEDKYKFDLKSTLARSQYYAAKKTYQQAYLYLTRFNQLSDSVATVEQQLYAKDLNFRLENMQNREALKSLEQRNQYKSYFLVFTCLFIIVLLTAILLFVRNVRQANAKRNEAIQHSMQLKNAFNEVEKLNKDYAKMMKIMAHDLKNPIGGMMGVANLLLDDKNISEENKDMLRLIANSGENSIEMINQLLNSRLAVEKEEVVKEQIDIQKLLRECVGLLQYKANEKQQKIILVSGGPATMMVAREKMWRVFNNLIVNAIKFSPTDTDIKVILERQKKSIRISVIDRGIGVPDENKQKIFEMFTKAKRSGTAGEQPFGLGLAISKQIIESHNGKIGLQDNPEGGTVFYVELPI